VKPGRKRAGAAHRPRRRFGQHFLAPAWAAKVVAAIAPEPGDVFLEIGPGTGALTLPLAAHGVPILAVEIDRDLVASLAGRVPGNVTLMTADFLKTDVIPFLSGLGSQRPPAEGHPEPRRRYRVVGNLPYNLSSPILFHLLEQAGRVADQHFMLQREVAQRMAATPAGKDYGRLSVMLQWRYRIENVLEVAPTAFLPPPRVDSAVVRMTPRPLPEDTGHEWLSELVRVAFSQRRKLLRHTLGRWLEARGFAGAFDLQRRAEEVPVAQYVALARQLAEA
jgi:16S rRNA (adenine1518-N6/adenine1519-N6)-dimethyltransferase